MKQILPNRATCPACGAGYDSGTFCPIDGTRLVDSPPNSSSRVGEIVGDRYRLLERIGEGGMGEVFRAEHLYIQKKVALKLLHGNLARRSDAIERLQREAHTTSGIGHPNIVRIEDFGHLPDGSVFLAMEWLRGESLRERLQKGPLPLSEALEVGAQTCSALVAAHAQDVVHRDVKPANIFLAQDDGGNETVKLVDFGIARLLRTESHLTAHGEFIGTPDYVAPELVQGEEVTFASDLYSMGVLLYELATGVLPFSANTTLALLHKKTCEIPVPPSARSPQRYVPPALEALIMRALALRPGDRHDSAAALLAEIRSVQESLAETAPQQALQSPPQKTGTSSGSSAVPKLEKQAALDESLEFAPPSNRKAVLIVLASLLAVGAGLAALLLWGTSDESGSSGAEKRDASPGKTAAGDSGSHVDGVNPELPAQDEGWSHKGRGDGFDFEVTVAPSRIDPETPFRLRFELVPRAQELESAVASGEVSAVIHYAYYRGHRSAAEVSVPVAKTGSFVTEWQAPDVGKYHVSLELRQKTRRVASARFDICVGADPRSPEAASTCPRMNPR